MVSAIETTARTSGSGLVVLPLATTPESIVERKRLLDLVNAARNARGQPPFTDAKADMKFGYQEFEYGAAALQRRAVAAAGKAPKAAAKPKSLKSPQHAKAPKKQVGSAASSAASGGVAGGRDDSGSASSSSAPSVPARASGRIAGSASTAAAAAATAALFAPAPAASARQRTNMALAAAAAAASASRAAASAALLAAAVSAIPAASSRGVGAATASSASAAALPPLAPLAPVVYASPRAAASAGASAPLAAVTSAAANSSAAASAVPFPAAVFQFAAAAPAAVAPKRAAAAAPPAAAAVAGVAPGGGDDKSAGYIRYLPGVKAGGGAEIVAGGESGNWKDQHALTSYWTRQQAMEQFENTLDLAEAMWPFHRFLIVVDNAASHLSDEPGALRVKHMNLGDTEDVKAKTVHFLRDTTFTNADGGCVKQEMYWREGAAKAAGGGVYPHDVPKGVKTVLMERNLWPAGGLKLDAARALLAQQPDFANEKSALEKMYTSRGHLYLRLPVCHPELASVERRWAFSKRIARSKCTYDVKVFRRDLRSYVTAQSMLYTRRCFRKTRDFMRAYAAKAAEAAAKVAAAAAAAAAVAPGGAAAAAPAVAVIEDLLKPEEKTVYAEYTARITQLEITKLMKEYKSHRRAGCEELPPDSDEDNGELSA